MSHRDRSIANMRCEAKRIYNQRRYINKLEKDLTNQNNKNRELQQKIDKAIEYIETQIQEGRSDSNLWLMGCYDEDKKILEILKGGNDD